MEGNWVSMWTCISGHFGTQKDPQTYTKSFYRLDEYKATYSNPILHPRTADDTQPLLLNYATYLRENDDTSSSDDSSDDGVQPPNTRRLAGRPKKKRIRRIVEDELETRPFKCGRCGGNGHSILNIQHCRPTTRHLCQSHK